MRRAKATLPRGCPAGRRVSGKSHGRRASHPAAGTETCIRPGDQLGEAYTGSRQAEIRETCGHVGDCARSGQWLRGRRRGVRSDRDELHSHTRPIHPDWHLPGPGDRPVPDRPGRWYLQRRGDGGRPVGAAPTVRWVPGRRSARTGVGGWGRGQGRSESGGQGVKKNAGGSSIGRQVGPIGINCLGALHAAQTTGGKSSRPGGAARTSAGGGP